MKNIKEKAKKRINRLFDLAEKDPKMGSRYIGIARKIAMRLNLKIPKELKRKYCHHCLSYFTSKNSRIRVKNNMRVTYCTKCKHYNRVKLS